jgi:hypothetical protein
MAIPPTKGHKQVLEQLCDTLGEVDRVALQSDIGANVSKSKKYCESITWIKDHRVEDINEQAVAYGEAFMISLTETDVLQSSWEHQMNSHIPTRLLSRRKQRKCFKSWRFKFKQVKEGNKQQHNLFRQMGTITILWWWLQNGSKVQWHILIVKRVSEIFGELKRVQASNAIIYVLSYGNHHYKLSWHFKLIYWQFLYSFKTELYEEAVTGTEHFQHHEQDKFLTTWLLKFDKPCVQGELIAYEGEIVGFYTTIGDRDIYFSVWHCWRKKKLHIINLQQLATVLHIYEKPKLGDFSQSYLLVAATLWSTKMQRGIESYHVWHRWKARYLQIFEYKFDAGSNPNCELATLVQNRGLKLSHVHELQRRGHHILQELSEACSSSMRYTQYLRDNVSLG